jgi:hypothetical protein
MFVFSMKEKEEQNLNLIKKSHEICVTTGITKNAERDNPFYEFKSFNVHNIIIIMSLGW